MACSTLDCFNSNKPYDRVWCKGSTTDFDSVDVSSILATLTSPITWFEEIGPLGMYEWGYTFVTTSHTLTNDLIPIRHSFHSFCIRFRNLIAHGAERVLSQPLRMCARSLSNESWQSGTDVWQLGQTSLCKGITGNMPIGREVGESPTPCTIGDVPRWVSYQIKIR